MDRHDHPRARSRLDGIESQQVGNATDHVIGGSQDGRASTARDAIERADQQEHHRAPTPATHPED